MQNKLIQTFIAGFMVAILPTPTKALTNIVGNRLIVGTSVQVTSDYGTVAGGIYNTNAGPFGVISGGESNLIKASPLVAWSEYSVISGGKANTIHTNAKHSVIAGGIYNQIGINAYESVIGGGYGNIIDEMSYQGVIAGGVGGFIGECSGYASILGGSLNKIVENGHYATLGGGWANVIKGMISTNSLSGSTIAGGLTNYIGLDSQFATIAGGLENVLETGSSLAFIGGGKNNFITNAGHAVLGGGWSNAIVGGSFATVSGGFSNSATGWYDTVPGGMFNAAAGGLSYAAGYRAKATHVGSFVWGDYTGADVASTANNQMTFRCNGGVNFHGTGTGTQKVEWKPGDASWTFTSDRNQKENFDSVNCRTLLEKVTSLPISEWSYKGHSKRHIGPMAQDFHSQFALGGSETTIDAADLQGVAFGAIQGLDEKLNESAREQKAALLARDSRIADLEKQLVELKKLVERLGTQQAPTGN